MPRPRVTYLRTRPGEGGGSWIVEAEEAGRVATVLGWTRFLRFDQVGIGFAAVESVRAARTRMEYIECIVVDVSR